MSKKHVSRLVSALLAIMMLSSYFCSLNVATFAAEQKSNGGFSVKLNWNGEINSTNLEWNPTTNTSKVLRLNVSYDNTNAETEEYQPDELTITVNGIGATGRDGKFTKAASIAADEKSSANKSYDWSYEYNSATDVYTFYNNNYIDSKTNFSGSFEILWSLQARNVVNGHAFEFTADLHGDGYTVTSNTVKFSFTSVGDLFALQESAEPLSNPQGLGNHEIVLDDYIWVRYNINKAQTTRSRGVRTSYHEVYIGEDVLLRQAYTQQNEKVSFKSIGDGWYKVNTDKNFYIIVGYPKSIYLADEETAVVTSYSKYIGTYYDESNSAVLATAETTINLNDYGFTGSLFSKETDSQIFEYTEIFNNKVVNFFYSGVELTTGYINEIGDDFLDVLLNNGEFRQLEPEEYEFSSVYIPSLADFEDYSTGEAPADPFTFEVWGLMIGEDDYIKLVDVQVKSESYWLDLPEGVYRINHVVTGVTQNLLAKDSAFSFNVTLHLNDDSELEEGLRVAENGYIRNISYDNRHEPGAGYRPGSEENYTGTYAQCNMDRDMETYGHLWCRALADVVYRGNLNSISTTISMNEFTDENRNYRTTVAIASTLKTTSENTEGNFVSKFSQYTILPTGLSVDPDKFNFKTSLNTSSMLLQDGTIINKTASYIKRHVSVDIIENYRNSGRTFVAFHYDFSDNPVNISATHKFTVSFDVLLDGESYLEFGGTYTVHGVTMVEESTSTFEGETRTGSDNGSFINEDESLWMDLDNDGNTDEQITYHSATRTIVIAQAAYQEVKETVKTIYTNNEYVDDTAIAGMGTTYTYRMKLQTGASRAKNIKFISVLENTECAEWQGTFQSVDTSYAEGKGFVPTVYYSESDTPSEDLTSAEWSTTAPENLENVKAIAVEFEGVQIDNSLLYFLVNMTAPDDDSLIGKKTENEYSVSFTSVDLVTEQETDSGTLKSNMVRVVLKDALGDVVITKIDETNGHKLAGATFDVYSVADNEFITSATTNSTGRAVIRNMDFGEYYAVETKAPNGYELNEDPIYFTVGLESFETGTNTVQISVPNTRMKGTVVLTKTNSEDSTIPVQGATYGLYKSNGTLVQEGFVTNSDGQVTVDELEWGSYYFLETERAQGYEINNDKVYFELDPDNVGEVVYVSTTDVQKPVSVILTKYDKPDTGSEITSMPVDGAIYALYKVDDENNTLVVSGLVTNSNGQVRVDNLLVGDYYFIETGKAVGYQLNSKKIYFSVTTEDAEIGLVTTSTYDIRIKGSVTLVKTNPDGDYVKDAVFTLFDSNDQIVYDDLVTGADGQIIVRDLQWGSYYFKEKSAPTGYELSDKKIEFEINRDNAETMQVVYAENTEKLSTVRLIKTSAEDPTEFLQGAVFNLYRTDGTEFATNLVTDSNGVIEVTNVPWGSYYFVETQAPSGFSLSSEKIRFSINYLSAGSTFEVYATNEHDTRQIDVTKRILASDINWANGDPTFLFTLSTTESSRYDNKYNAIISFDREYVLSHTGEDGYVEKTASFTGLYADQYVLTEKDTLRYEFVDIRDVVNGVAYYGNDAHPVYGNCVAFDLDKSEYGAATFTNVKTNWSDASHTGNNTNIINVSRKVTALIAEINNNPVTHESSQDLDLTVYAVYDSGERELLERDQYIIEDITFDLTQNGFYDVHVYYTERGKTVVSTVIAEVSTDALFTYVIKNGKAIITGYLGNSDTVVFPKIIKGYEVTVLGNGTAISGMDNVTTIVISDGITQIGNSAFKNCSSLTGSIALPNSVTNIGDSAFYGCSGITNLVISENVGAISANAFFGCSEITNITMPISAYPAASTTFKGCTNVSSVKLTKGTGIGYNYTSTTCKYTPWYLSRTNSNGITLTIEDGITSIGNYMFDYCSGLTGELIIPDSVQIIGRYAFERCNKLTSITIGNSVTTIGEYAFIGCSRATGELVIPDSVETIGAWAFQVCMNFTKLSIGNSVISIGDYAFHDCTGLTGNLVIPDSVEIIGNSAFELCTNLTSITIGKGITKIGGYAFDRCSNLSIIRIDKPYDSVSGKPWEAAYCAIIWNDSIFDTNTGLIYYEDGNHMIVTGLYDPDRTITSIEIPSIYQDKPVTAIAKKAFAGYSILTSVIIPESITSIGESAFSGCFRLTGNLIIPDSVETIENKAFYGCSKITSVTIGSSVISVGASAFSGCAELTGELVIPDSVKMIGESAFGFCQKLTSVTIGSGVTSISSSAFNQSHGINVIRIDKPYDSVAGKPWEATAACVIWNNSIMDTDTGLVYYEDNGNMLVTGLYDPNGAVTSIDIPSTYQGKTVISIEVGAFQEHSALVNVTIPNSITSIEDYAFYACRGLTTIDIPNSVISIGQSAFHGCTGLSGELVIPSSVKTIGVSAFQACKKITSLTIEYGVTSIGESAFYYCTGLTGELIIPDSVETISLKAFQDCSGITSVIIGNKITEIVSYTFRGCKNLENVVISDNVTSISYDAFYGCSGITSITMPISAAPKSKRAFQGCSSVSSVTLTKGTGTGYNYTASTYSWTPWYNSRSNPNGIIVTIEDGVTSIGNFTFAYCASLTSIKIAGSVTSIGQYAFYECLKLTDITIPDNVEKIGYRAFSGCTKLAEVTILNPDCLIYDDANTIYSGATIRGYAGSTAESYATKYGRTFEAITEEVQTTSLTFPNKRFSKRPDEAE